MSKIIDYKKGKFTVVWEPALCEHAGVCVKSLPKVYRPKERPWIDVSQATEDELREQIDRCPSGALSYRKED
jgi:uncharacterized Fe-S cluster protein YjdI